jgi:hypothetical protein
MAGPARAGHSRKPAGWAATCGLPPSGPRGRRAFCDSPACRKLRYRIWDRFDGGMSEWRDGEGTHVQPKTTEINQLHATSRSNPASQTDDQITKHVLTSDERPQSDDSVDTFPDRLDRRIIESIGAVRPHTNKPRPNFGEGPGKGTARHCPGMTHLHPLPTSSAHPTPSLRAG